MKPALKALLISIAFMSSASAQTPDPDPALNNPDKVSWELFAMVNKSVPGVNNNGQYGRWAFAEFTEVYQIEADFEAKVKAEFDKMISNHLAEEAV